jgi:phage terminase small subunit
MTIAGDLARAEGTTTVAREKYLRCAKEYCRNGFNKTMALEKVYRYSHRTAMQNTWRIFSHPVTMNEVERLLKMANDRLEMGPERVLQLLGLYAEAGIHLAKFKKVNGNGDLYWDFTDATEEELLLVNQLETAEYTEGRGEGARDIKKFKIGHSDPLAAIDKLARVYGMYDDKLKLSGEMSLIDRINAGQKRAGAKKDDKDGA